MGGGRSGRGTNRRTLRKPDTEPKTLRNAARQTDPQSPTGRETEIQKDGDPESVNERGGSRHCRAGGQSPKTQDQRARERGKETGWMWGHRESDRDPERQRDRDPETVRQRVRRHTQRSRS